MPARERLRYLGSRRGERLLREFADEVRDARLAAGLTQAQVADLAGISAPAVSRIERVRPPFPDVLVAARLARVVGLELSLKCFPAGSRLRDAAQLRLLARFLARLPASVGRRLESPIRLAGDQRAWDVLLSVGGERIGVAAETRIRDVQALLRREQAKARDDAVDRLLLVVAGTRGNRRAMREAQPIFAQALPLGTRAVLRALARGELPPQGGVVIL